MTSRLALTGFALILAVGCSSESEPSIPATGNVFRVDLSSERFGAIAAFIHDDVGIVIDAHRFEGRLPRGAADDRVLADPNTSSLIVTWLGGACDLGPTVTLSGGEGDLVVTLRPDANEGYTGPPPEACILIGITYKIRLLLASPVGQDAITLRVVQ